jgi:hypothetical protein
LLRRLSWPICVLHVRPLSPEHPPSRIIRCSHTCTCPPTLQATRPLAPCPSQPHAVSIKPPLAHWLLLPFTHSPTRPLACSLTRLCHGSDLYSRTPGFHPTPVYVGFVVDRVSPRRGFLSVLQFPSRQYHSTDAACSFIVTQALYNVSSRQRP